MKKSGVYLWLLIVAQALMLVTTVHVLVLSLRPGSHGAPIKSAFADVNGGIKTMLAMFKKDCRRYPTQKEGLKVLIEPPRDGSLVGWRGPYLDLSKIPKDPWGHEYVYRFPAIYSTNGYDLYSCGPDGISNSGDDIGNWDKPISAPAGLYVYRKTLSDRIHQWLSFWPLIIPVLYGLRLVAGVLSRRAAMVMSENPIGDRVWLWMSLTILILLWMFPLL
jgi:type II secretion system protein G